jgi:hypothetical protein
VYWMCCQPAWIEARAGLVPLTSHWCDIDIEVCAKDEFDLTPEAGQVLMGILFTVNCYHTETALISGFFM